MKNKITPSVILLIITVIFFIAGIFFMGIQARQEMSDTEQSLDAYRQQKASGRQTAVQEHRDTQESSEAVTSVFSQGHS